MKSVLLFWNLYYDIYQIYNRIAPEGPSVNIKNTNKLALGMFCTIYQIFLINIFN